jgi:hypothetical protein
MKQSQWNNGVILDVKQELGEIKGRVTGIETSMKENREDVKENREDVKENREDVKEILKSVSVIPELQRMLVEHLKEDEPTELYVNRNMASWMKNGMWVAATGLAGWFVAKVTGR